MIDLDSLIDRIDINNLIVPFGRINHISSTTITAAGLQVAVGDIVKIESEQRLYSVLGMVASIGKESFTIVPFSFIEGFRINDKVFLQREGLSVKTGYGLLGRVVNALGEPIDGKGKVSNLEESSAINKVSMPALQRGIIDQKFSTGVKAVDSMLTSGKGQKVGIFAGSGVGKSTLMGMIVKGCEAQIKVVALIGERGREIPEFIHYNLDNNLENTIHWKDDDAGVSPENRTSGKYIKSKDGEKLGVIKDFTYITIKQRGKPNKTPDQIMQQLYQWIVNNIPESELQKELEDRTDTEPKVLRRP